MSINKNQLFKLVKEELLNQKFKLDFDLPILLYLIKETIFNDPRERCIIKGKKTDWAGLPQTKACLLQKTIVVCQLVTLHRNCLATYILTSSTIG